MLNSGFEDYLPAYLAGGRSVELLDEILHIKDDPVWNGILRKLRWAIAKNNTDPDIMVPKINITNSNHFFNMHVPWKPPVDMPGNTPCDRLMNFIKNMNRGGQVCLENSSKSMDLILKNKDQFHNVFSNSEQIQLNTLNGLEMKKISTLSKPFFLSDCEVVQNLKPLRHNSNSSLNLGELVQLSGGFQQTNTYLENLNAVDSSLFSKSSFFNDELEIMDFRWSGLR